LTLPWRKTTLAERKITCCESTGGEERPVQLKIELDREEDGRWIGTVAVLPGVLCYAASREEALCKVEALALRVMAERLEHGEAVPELDTVFSVAA
jgi:predicted RNase H-like HicB family nuclease